MAPPIKRGFSVKALSDILPPDAVDPVRVWWSRWLAWFNWGQRSDVPMAGGIQDVANWAAWWSGQYNGDGAALDFSENARRMQWAAETGRTGELRIDCDDVAGFAWAQCYRAPWATSCVVLKITDSSWIPGRAMGINMSHAVCQIETVDGARWIVETNGTFRCTPEVPDAISRCQQLYGPYGATFVSTSLMVYPFEAPRA